MHRVFLRIEVTIASNETPGYVSNASLAARLSALVDRWDTRENQMIAVLTQPTGDVTVTDGTDVNHQIPSFPSLQAQVTAMVDALTGEVAGVQAIASHVTALATAADQSATDAAMSADASATSAQESAESAAGSAQSATASDASATASEASRVGSDSRATASAASASESARQAIASAASAVTAANEADDSAASASTALIALGDAQSSRDLAHAWATNLEDQPVVDGEFSAMHWAKKAQSFATGSLVYLGAWDASSDTLPDGAKKGAFYKIVGTGTVDGVTYRNGDNIVHNGAGWDLIDNTETVTAVAGKVGNVALNIDDIAALTATLAAKASLNHQHAIADVIGLQASLDSAMPKAGGVFSGAITAPVVRAGGATGPAYYVGNDTCISDIDAANTLGIIGQSDTTKGGIKLGTSGPTLSGSAGRLDLTTNVYGPSFIGSAADNFRIAYGSYGTFWRNDGDTLYLMLTNAGDVNGAWNGLRPFTVKLNTGLVSFGNAISVGGRARVDELGLGASNRAVRLNDANYDIEIVNQQYTAVNTIIHNTGEVLAPDFQIWSDRRLKRNIEYLEFDAVSALRRMPPRHYLKHNAAMEPLGYEYGFIHDEVEAVFPDAAPRTAGTEDLPNLGTVATPQLVAVLAQAVLDLATRLDKAGLS